jgi:MYXO-CTERM domain-containing protein
MDAAEESAEASASGDAGGGGAGSGSSGGCGCGVATSTTCWPLGLTLLAAVHALRRRQRDRRCPEPARELSRE